MTIKNIILILLIAFPFMARSQQTKSDTGKVVVEQIQIEEIEEDIALPAHIKSKFKNLQDWLSAICDADKPKKPISVYQVNFSWSESPTEYILFLYGVNTYRDEKDRSVTRIDFEPSNMYFKIPEQEYKNLNRQQLQEKLTSAFKDFIKTEKFKTSFLAKADIVMKFNGERIWTGR